MTGAGSANGSSGQEVGEVWVVDDDQSIRWVLERALSRAGLRVRGFPQAAEVLAALGKQEPAVLVSDIRMPGASGIELLYQVRQLCPALPVIIMTAYSDLDSAVSTFQAGAFDYLPKPFDLLDAVDMIQRAVRTRAEAVSAPLAVEVPGGHLLGRAPAMQVVYRAIGRLSQSAATVLITGESGSGKELVARALHEHSARARKPFVALNMAAIPAELLESELFGHERGAFTGAQAMRQGRFEQAEGGTLFLDEIGDMPAEMQTRLLRVLSEGSFYRVGGNQSIRCNVRVVAATHQDLEARVREGRFREDLFHRLNVIRLRLPPLRERAEDVPVLAAHFLARSATALAIEPKRLGADALDALVAFRWPGNVRQLENVCQWLTVMTASALITAADLPPEIVGPEMPTAGRGAASGAETGAGVGVNTGTGAAGRAVAAAAVSPVASVSWSGQLAQTLRELLADPARIDLMPALVAEFERVLIGEALRHTAGHRIEAARRLGIGRNTITRKIRELGIADGVAADDGA